MGSKNPQELRLVTCRITPEKQNQSDLEIETLHSD